MKHLIHVILLVAFGIGHSLADDEGITPKFTHKLAADFGQCPDGHKALKDIPIVYGLVGPLYKKPKDYKDADRELSERHEKGEIVFGGEIIDEHSPKSQVVCQQCAFRYRPSMMPVDFPSMAYWSRESKSAADFQIKFSKRLLSVPLLKPSMSSVNYSQTLSADGMQLHTESLSYRTPMPIDEVLKAVSALGSVLAL